MSKADHLLTILWLLKTRTRMSAAQLAEELELNVRTIYRYIDSLCASGVPIVSDTGRSGGYRLPEHVTVHPLFFDAEEQTALIHAAAFAQEAGYPHAEPLARAVAKIRTYTNEKQLSRLNRHAPGVDALQPPPDARLQPILQSLESSIADARSVVIGYRSGYDGPATTREIDPYGLVHWKSKWYAVGYCHLRGEIRSFRVDRIAELKTTGRTFEKPEAFSAKRFLLESLLPVGDPDDASLVALHVVGEPAAIDDLCRHWLLGHALVERSGSMARFEVEESALYAQIAYSLLPYGGKITIVSPDAFRSALAEIALAVSEHHRIAADSDIRKR